MGRKHSRNRRRKPRFERSVNIPDGSLPVVRGPVGIDLPAETSQDTKIMVTAYGPNQCIEKQIADVEECRAYLGQYPVTWVDMDGLSDLLAIKKLGEIFGIHPLALEDVVHVHQRAKVEPYENHLFIVARAAENKESIDTEQISIFVGKNFVLTFQEHPGDSLIGVRQRVVNARNYLSRSGPDHLAYLILDAIIDSYFPLIDQFADRLDALEDQVNTRSGIETMDGVHSLRSSLVLLRRALRPHREAVYELIRDPHPMITDTSRVFLRDCYDHTIQVLEMLEVYNDICSDLRDYYLSMASIRMNEVMKVLTIISTIFMPLSFIAGIFGMNFDTAHPWNMPELRWPLGYLYSLGLMGFLAAILVFVFWRRGWIGDQGPSYK